MMDTTDLKKLAEAAPEGPWFGPEYAPGTSYVFDVDLGTLLEYQSIDSEKDACLRYVAAANPAAVLAMIAELNDFKQGSKVEADAGDEARAEVRKLKDENDELKRENKELRKGIDPKWSVMDQSILVSHLRENTNFCADKFDAMIQFAVESAQYVELNPSKEADQ